MSKKIVFTVVTLLFLTAIVHSQTRRIAHRSHGGNMHARYDGGEGNYGDIRPRKLRVHMESGKDTLVDPWDSLARPYYLDTMPQGQLQYPPREKVRDIHEMGNVTGRMVL